MTHGTLSSFHRERKIPGSQTRLEVTVGVSQPSEVEVSKRISGSPAVAWYAEFLLELRGSSRRVTDMYELIQTPRAVPVSLCLTLQSQILLHPYFMLLINCRTPRALHKLVLKSWKILSKKKNE
ncbi:Ferredoxin--nitrite reductase [Clarias magur]|uniref:Ferredoxin--nitrite reductase n=1 Tax=Clarias magur TaxID=1594786 RepID=A0A8J4UTB9_CLAMG|nr:Ferredoxin--nitrite reductase [Clarias magur]